MTLPFPSVLRRSCLVAALALPAAPALAQFYDRPAPYGYNAPVAPYGYGYGYGPRPARLLRPDEIQDRVEDQGFEDVGPPRFAGDTYQVTAISPMGRRVRLSVDPYRGIVLGRAALGGDSYGRDGWELEEAPRGALGGRIARPSPFDEAPDAPRIVPPPPGTPREEPRNTARRPGPPLSALPRPSDPRLAPDANGPRSEPREPAPREAARQPESPPSGALPQPADSRLGPPAAEEGRSQAPAPRRDASRPAEPAAPSGSGLYGTNPGGGGSRAASRPARPTPEPARPATRPASPPATAQASPAETRPGDRKVRVIEGVTPMNGGQQSSPPPPQNNPDGSANPVQ